MDCVLCEYKSRLSPVIVLICSETVFAACAAGLTWDEEFFVSVTSEKSALRRESIRKRLNAPAPAWPPPAPRRSSAATSLTARLLDGPKQVNSCNKEFLGSGAQRINNLQ
jgi:hypothetical protein